MKKSLAHLPKRKREELRYITDLIRKKSKYPQIIILFGSFARRDWVEDVYVEDNITYEYKSDYDILVITKTKKIADRFTYWEDIARKAAKLPITNRVTIIAHYIEFINAQLRKGQYFFTEIKKEGILLYDSGKLKLAPARKRDMTHRARDAKENFKQFFKSARIFYSTFEYNFGNRQYKHAAFQLHQATELLYKTVIMVFTSYRPKGHFLDTLGSMCAGFDPRFLTVFPQQSENEKKCLDLLNSAYIDARYKKNYKTCARGGGYQKTPARIFSQTSTKTTNTNREDLQRKNRLIHIIFTPTFHAGSSPYPLPALRQKKYPRPKAGSFT
jgi:HEPN domain-containing protein/predicted nucleotidyltransferase